MKKLIIVIAALICVGCAPLREDGTFSSEEFIGKFRGTAIYRVSTPDGFSLYLGVDDEDTLQSVTLPGKVSFHVIYIDGKQVSIDEAKRLLEMEE